MKNFSEFREAQKNKVLQVVMDLIGEEPIPPCLSKTINKFYLAGIGIIIVTTILVIVLRSFLMNWFGFVIGIAFIICGLYLTRQYKLKHYEVIEGTCLEIKLGSLDSITGAMSKNKLTGEKRKYIIETIDGVILEVHASYKNDRIQKGRGVIVYIRPNTLREEQTVIYGCLGIDVLTEQPAVDISDLFEDEQ